MRVRTISLSIALVLGLAACAEVPTEPVSTIAAPTPAAFNKMGTAAVVITPTSGKCTSSKPLIGSTCSYVEWRINAVCNLSSDCAFTNTPSGSIDIVSTDGKVKGSWKWDGKNPSLKVERNGPIFQSIYLPNKTTFKITGKVTYRGLNDNYAYTTRTINFSKTFTTSSCTVFCPDQVTLPDLVLNYRATSAKW